MKYYENMLEKGCFNREDLIEMTGSPAAASSIIYDYLRKDYIERVRRNFYAVISLETKQPVLSRYQIGSRLFSDACLTHHSAFEAYGYANQVFYELYVATENRFEKFEYNGVLYHRVDLKDNIDVMENGMIRVTGIEQTVVDSIRDFEKIAGLEETCRCIMLVPGLNEDKILEALERSHNVFLYQKCGYILEQLRDSVNLSDAFFRECEKHITQSKRYLLKDEDCPTWNERWRLYTPGGLQRLLDKGVVDYDAI